MVRNAEVQSQGQVRPSVVITWMGGLLTKSLRLGKSPSRLMVYDL